MSLQVNLSGVEDINESYQNVISGNDINWALFTYDNGGNVLKVQSTGNEGVEELVKEFSDERIQYAFARVIDQNTQLPKFVQINWCGDGVPEADKGFFHVYSSAVASLLRGTHVVIDACNEADIVPSLIMRRVEVDAAILSASRPTISPGSPAYSNTQGNTTSASSSETDTSFSVPLPPRVNGALTINPTPGITTPPSPSETNSSFASPSPSGVNGRHAMNPAVQPPSASFPGVPSTVASASEDFDPQDETSIDFERDFREWFSPEPTPTNPRFSAPSPPRVNGRRPVSPSETSSSLASLSPSGVNGRHAANPAVQPTSASLPAVPPNFLSSDFMESVASSLEDFDPQVLFRQDETGINFEQDFREWFSPEGMESMRND
ncbi:hypothetical protein SCLCIDRAFT_1008163 [Scleroderma citrinum Foug A]|uniref:ADF-H domain-containing protein n=1 Tax=Scleroderma citrinum Foug A TaxID=1036808 RepID=A0A0C3EIW3_9AGAM|nr:hypothetical protein SCLCIDRAFT_1008163 [Scleroderma citrinum Foug A]